MELNDDELRCSVEDDHDYYLDEYYHDDGNAPVPKISKAEVILLSLRWKQKGLELMWQIDDQAIPYSCEAVFIYQHVPAAPDGFHQLLTEKVDANCSSDTAVNPHRIEMVVPTGNLISGNVYRYCLLLLVRGTGDMEGFLPGCSEPLQLSMPIKIITKSGSHNRIGTITAGSLNGTMVVQTRVESVSFPCTYTVVLVSNTSIVASRQLNCSESRHEFLSLIEGKKYTSCADIDNSASATRDFHALEHKLKKSENVSEVLHSSFSICTPPIQLEKPPSGNSSSGPWFILLFTLPGLVLIITLYLIGRRVWKGGGMRWKWDPRANKSAKYFLYTGETTTPSVSLDPLPEDCTENTTRV